MSLVLILLKKFFFSLLIKLTQRFRCLLYAFLPKSFFVFKNLFLRRDLIIISIYLFIHEKRLVCWNIPLFYGSMYLNSFIKGCFKSIRLKIVVLRSHLINTVFNLKHKRFIRKVFKIPIRHNICFLFFLWKTSNINASLEKCSKFRYVTIFVFCFFVEYFHYCQRHFMKV